jgi:hydroxypyruvate isomerase
MLKLSANLSLLFTERPLIERFAAARAAGFRAVEIQFPYELSIDALRTELAQHELSLILINVPAGDLMQGGDGLAGVPGREHAFQHAVRDALRYAEALHVPTINVLAGRLPDNGNRDHCLETLEQNLRLAVDTFHPAGITTVIEAINTVDMPRFLLHSFRHMEEMLTRIPHPGLKMQFDCYHMERMGENIAQCLRDNIGAIGHIQFADVPGRHEPGTGAMNYPELFTLLRELPYTGWTGAEYRPSTLTEDTLTWLAAATGEAS